MGTETQLLSREPGTLLLPQSACCAQLPEIMLQTRL